MENVFERLAEITKTPEIMKTDLDMFIETYKRFGIGILPFENNSTPNIFVSLNDPGFHYPTSESDKFKGYSGHSTLLEFTPEGKFISQSFYSY